MKQFKMGNFFATKFYCYWISFSRNSCITWHPEACNYMIEGVPSIPYGYISSYLNGVQANMTLRRRQAQKMLSEESDCEYVLNISAFPQ